MRASQAAKAVLVVGVALLGETAAGQQTLVAEPRPQVSIGLAEGPDALMFRGVGGALRLSDGRIVVANCSSSEIRYFSPNGAHLITMGRAGDGPGEFRYLRRIFHAGGDSIGAFDGAPAFRLSLLTPEAKLARTLSLPARIDVIGRLKSGRFIGRVQRQRPRTPGVGRDALSLYLITASGELADSMAGLPGTETIVTADGRSRQLRLGRLSVVAALPDRITFGDQSSSSYVEFDDKLAHLRVVKTITDPAAVTSTTRQVWESSREVMVPRDGVVAAYASEFSESQPAYRDMSAAQDGSLWLQDPSRPGEYPLIWTAYRDGKAAARAELPPRFFPTEFGPDWVLGVAFDSLAVESVQLLQLRPGPLSGKRLSPRDAQPPDQPRCGPWTSR